MGSAGGEEHFIELATCFGGLDLIEIQLLPTFSNVISSLTKLVLLSVIIVHHSSEFSRVMEHRHCQISCSMKEYKDYQMNIKAFSDISLTVSPTSNIRAPYALTNRQ